ncbi:MAG: Type 1 glutamine amidotransferase-like domain-containing protein [Patescibacteria group bacterium]
MTKYILHGGETSRPTSDNKQFFIGITSDLNNKATILCVYFARTKEKWPAMLEQDKINFSSASRQKNLNVTMADDELNNFAEQIKQADVIYLRGGDTDTLKIILNKMKNLDELWRGKIVAASSAGVYVLSKYYYSNSKDNIGDGLGILPIKSICHYKEEKSDKLERLKKHGEDLPVYAIPEEKFFIVEK